MPISDTRIWTGSEWQSLVGPTGPSGPIVVSANAGNLAKLGTDNRVLVAQADLDERYVNVTGDTLSGGLIFQKEGEVFIDLRAFSSTLNAAVRFRRFRGTIAAPVVLQPLDHIGRFTYATNDASGTLRTSAFSCTAVQIAATGVETQYSFIVSLASGLTVTPLLVTKDGISVTGNITSTGTAHNFAANSITASAILGLPAASTVMPLVDAATAVIGVSTAYARADHVHPLPTAAAPPASDCNFYQAGRTITAEDRGKLIVNNSNNPGEVTFILPDDSVFAVGVRLDFVDASGTADTLIQAPAGGQLVYSSTLTAGGGAGTVITITGRVKLASPYFRLTAIKVKANQWILFN